MTNSSNPPNQSPIQGQCLCGAVAFEAMSMGHTHACHCSDCRTHHGAAFHAVSVRDFRLTQGEAHLREYASSEWACRGFCDQCGSGLYYRTQDHAFYGVSLGCVQSAQPALQSHIYVESAEIDAHNPEQADIWDDLPQLTGAEFLRAEGLEELAEIAAKQTPLPIASIVGSHSGGCHCGKVRFRTNGDLRPIQVCHCRQCQQQASGYYRATNSKSADFTLEKHESLRWYQSSADAERGFCGDCGSTLFWRKTDGSKTDGASTISIQTGVFDERLPLPTEKHIFTQDASGAIPLPEGKL